MVGVNINIIKKPVAVVAVTDSADPRLMLLEVHYVALSGNTPGLKCLKL